MFLVHLFSFVGTKLKGVPSGSFMIGRKTHIMVILIVNVPLSDIVSGDEGIDLQTVELD